MKKDSETVIWVIVGGADEGVYGYGGYTGKTIHREENIATFDTKQMAEDYIKKAKLKNPQAHDRPFRKNSLLWNCEYADVEEYFPEVLEHNPVL